LVEGGEVALKTVIIELKTIKVVYLMTLAVSQGTWRISLDDNGKKLEGSSSA
jgi:hypothetical protein